MITTEAGATRNTLQDTLKTRRELLVVWRSVFIGLFPFSHLQAKETIVNIKTMNVWQLINTIANEMPVSQSKIEPLLGIVFKVEKREYFSSLTAAGPQLNDGMTLNKVSLLIRPSMQFDEKSALALKLAGACISLSDVRQHYGQLNITQQPRGRSQEETTVHALDQPWGSLSFAFKETKPDCLSSITFRTAKI